MSVGKSFELRVKQSFYTRQRCHSDQYPIAPKVVILSEAGLNVGLGGLPRRISKVDLASSANLEIPRFQGHYPWLLGTHSG
ncbi:hypothetical protein [Gracilimonas halophila]|uniref:Uncharacterized protein n=1 Tax=Gracilimonas halophila TaxID=1834464 RepID=A0ABW5JH33_9BACT